MEQKTHFGMKIQKRKYSFKLVREEFAFINTKPSLPKFESLVKRGAYTDDTGTEYAVEWCQNYRELCLKNYDINMEYYKSLSQEEFDKVLNKYLEEHRFKEVIDLNEYSGVYGYYIMVLDEYKQVYIGKAEDIKKRIKQHWNKTKSFDRILFPMYNVNKSVFSIDFFRPLDTTRIYVWKKALSEGIERKLVKDFPSKFLCNRIGGDVTNALEAIATITKH